MIEELLKIIESIILSVQTNNDDELFFELEKFCFDNYEAVKKENDEISSIMNDEIIDLCSEISKGQDCRKERDNLKEIYNKIKSKNVY